MRLSQTRSVIRTLMNQKELGEIRRRIRPEHNAIHHIYGCYVNASKEIISEIDEPVGLLTQEETEKYFGLLKKTLSGALGKNLLDISFASKQVMDSEEHRLLSALRKSELADAGLRTAFYQCIIDRIDVEDQNYLILMAYDVYDVPHYGKDGENTDSSDLYKYMLCCICPVKSGRAELGYDAGEKRFHSAVMGQVVAPPELGFLFPTFDDRAANIYNALFYSKNINASHEDFVDAVFKTPVPMPAGQQRENFNEILSGALDRSCRFDVVQAVHEQLSERIAVYKETNDPEPMTVSVDEMGEILENSGATQDQVEAFRKGCRESLGEDVALRPGNLTNTSKMEISTPEVKISVNPKYSYLVETRVIDGKKYILVSADAGVELNGVAVEIRE